MRVIGINGSPRLKGNTFTLVDAVLRGAASQGAETRLVQLTKLDMKPCRSCDTCKKDKHLARCVLKDDLSPLLEELKEYDAIVMGTPVYWIQVSAQLKTLIDRAYCYFRWGLTEKGEITVDKFFPEGKKFVMVTSRGEPEPPTQLPELYQQIQAWLEFVARELQASSVQVINHVASLTSAHSAEGNTELLAKAESTGASLAG
jgi:multimeric flavodoxin WrbA